MKRIKVFVHSDCKKVSRKVNKWLKKKKDVIESIEILQSLTRAEFAITVVYVFKEK